MRDAFRAVWANPYVRVLVAVAGLYALYHLLAWSQLVWGTVLVAYLFAFLLHPLVTRFESWGLGRSTGVLVVGLTLVAFLVALWFLGVRAVAQISLLIGELPSLIETYEEMPFLIARGIDPGFGDVFHEVFVRLDAQMLALAERSGPLLEGLRDQLVRRLLTADRAGLVVAMVLVIGFHLLHRFPRYNRAFLTAIPERHRAGVERLSGRAADAVGGYIRGQILIAGIVGTLIGIGLAVVGVPLALTIGLISAVGNLIPFVGPIIAAVPALLLAVTQGVPTMLLAVGVLLLVQQLDGNVLTPMVLSRTTAVDEVTILFAVLMGAVLFGIWGALLAVPVAVFATILYRDYYLESAWYRGG